MELQHTLALAAGAVWSVLIGHVPTLKSRFDVLSGEAKRLVMTAVMAVTAVILYFVGCYDILGISIECGRQGILDLLTAFILLVVGNQTAYSIAVEDLHKGDSPES